MIYVHWENFNGGTNNLCVARDDRRGLVATSTKDKKAAIKNLRKAIRRQK